MEKLSGLVLQLKVKTGFIVDDDLDPLLNDEIEKAKIEMRYEDDILQNMLVKIAIKQTELNQPGQPPARIGIAQYEAWFKDIKAKPDDPPIYKFMDVLAFKQAYLDKFVPPASRSKDDYTLYGSFNAEIDRLKSLIKSTLNTNKIMSTTAFEKLNTISDTIPNLINQILSLAQGISKIVVTKITEWPTEISNEDLSRVIDTSNEMIEDVALINSKAGIQPYITIYNKLKKPIEDIYKSVNEMGKLAGVISYDDTVYNQFKYTNTIGNTNGTGPPIPDAPDADDKETNEIKTLLLEIQNDILQKTDPSIISPKLDSFIEELKKNVIFDGSMQMNFAKIVKMSKSSTSSKAWDKKVKKQIKDFITLLDNAAPKLKSKDKKTIGSAIAGAFASPGGVSGAGKFMHSYHAKRFL
jgi:hypothetical protein